MSFSGIVNILIAVIIFSLIVIFHELGHFLLAKRNGIAVTEFSLGMGPRLISTVKGGTRYSLKLFPIGGSCMMVGRMMMTTVQVPLTTPLCGPESLWWRQVLYSTLSWHLYAP